MKKPHVEHWRLAIVSSLLFMACLTLTAVGGDIGPGDTSKAFTAFLQGEPLKQTGPDSPGVRSDDDGREAAFRETLVANGFIVNEGSMPFKDPISLHDQGIMASANANNAGQFYKILRVPIFPVVEEDPSEAASGVFRLRPSEAIVYVGPTPPQCDYFSFCIFLWQRQKDRIIRKGDWIFAAVNDPLNNALIRTEGKGNPFHKQTIVIFTADQGVYERVAALARAAGYPESMINPYVIPSGLLNLGVLPDSRESDSLLILMRTANFTSEAQENQYLSNDNYANVWRVTPRVAPPLEPFPTPEPRNRKGISETSLFPDLQNGLERLKAAILAQTPNIRYESYESIRWWPDSREVLEEDDPEAANYHKFVAGEASDTPYRRSAWNGEAANFTLGENDMVVVYGVNHAATGLATYSNFGVYGDWVTSSCDEHLFEYIFGCDDHIWNGVADMTDHEFQGSAERYIPGDPMAPYLYAVKVLRQPPQDKHERYFVVVPESTPEAPGYGIALDAPITIGYRAYLNPATAAGTDYEDIISDRAIWFQLRE